uniref:CDP-diacylglycerol--serine O-phosphatidyltransferase n=1 Tax=uncultured bacterium contig00017 TaxID=1181508 RepID=A0A806KAJ6_9BACT|nr:CDP-diacylglycerol--serine O-phosphatidyltransferase [uncultured bacterium contig00017]
MKKSLFIGFYGYWVILTYLGIIAAGAGMCFAIGGNIKSAIVCLMLTGICDMFDGPVARHAKRDEREKSFGIQIDSLADIVGFGILPAVIGYAVYVNGPAQDSGSFEVAVTVLMMSIYVLAALTRLAYYNVTEAELQSKDEKRKFYEGLPVTTVAIIIPITYALCVYFAFPLAAVYNKLLMVIALAFVVRIKVPKLKLRYLVGFLPAWIAHRDIYFEV